ncbi:MAG: hypothetical protein DMG86_14315 [Acidobacteria bacterium]|nr:MAG: hypothetical protein DMG86_14315 [Acidobacteriota bacterium]
MKTGDNSFDLALGVVPRHTRFPPQAEIEGDVRLELVCVLNVRATIPSAGIEKLLAALVVVDRRADQEVGEIRSGLTAIKCEIPIGCAGIALIDLQVAELAAE